MKEYTRLEYIEGNGSAYINTEIIPNDTTVVKVKLYMLSITGDSIIGHLGGTTSVRDDTKDWRLFNYSSSFYLDIYSQRVLVSGFSTKTIYELEFGNNYLKNLATNTNILSGTKESSFTTTLPIQVFKGNTTTVSGRIYYLQIFNNGAIVRNYTPVKNSEGVCGLYDSVEKKFYPSQGSSAFIGGEEIEDSPLSSPYGLRRRLMNEAYLTRITTIRINQNLTDPSAMITRIVDGGGIEAIRANSHRYVGVFDHATELMSLRQLDDNDGTKYLDGTTAPITTLGNDVWMKLPQFFYKAEEYETDVWDISFAYGNKPDDTFKEWDGKDLIGVYKACSSSTYMYSTSGKAAVALSYDNAYSYARNRVTGFSGMRWRYHCMFSFLFWAYYGTTYSTNVCGVASSSTKLTTGVNNSLGMNDTSSGTSIRVNFWGMEDYWGNMREYVTDTSASSSNGKVTVSNLDGTTSTYTDPSTSLYIVNKITITENLEFYPKTKSSTRTLFGDNFGAWNSSSNQTLTRTYSGGENTGVASIGFWVKNWSPDKGSGARLTYRGDYIIID